MTIRQRIRKYLSSSRSRSKLRSEPHEQDNNQTSQQPSKMTPKPQDTGDKPKELDAALRSSQKRSKLPAKTSTGETILAENVMDNWKLSSQKSAAQKDSLNLQLKNAWEARNRLPFDRSNGGSFEGRWDYEGTKKKWVADSSRRHFLRSNPPTTPLFPAHSGDKVVSKIYLEYWVKGDKAGFLNAIYKLFAENEVIPEKQVWKIFRCLLSELVPEDKIWDKPNATPSHIVAGPNTIWHVGKCMLHIVTRGRFWNNNMNVLSLTDQGETFGDFKKNELQQTYSKDLIRYILGCLSVLERDRPSREQLMSHFELVISILGGQNLPPIIDDDRDAPYIPKDSRIPRGLTKEEGEVYEKLIEIASARSEKGSNFKTPHIITITDLAKDYDDLMAMMCLKELHRLDIVHIEGFVANLMPAESRALFGRGALDSMGLRDTPCAIGTIGDKRRKLVKQSHEFDNTESFMAKGSDLPKGQELLEKVFRKAKKNNYKITFLGISSLMDIAKFAKNNGTLLKDGLENVVLQGGYRIVGDQLMADPAAANNKFDMDGSQEFHDFIHKYQIPSTVWTKVATEAVPIYNSLFVSLEETKHPLGPYIRKVQVNQDLNFYKRACSDNPFAPHMTQDWYVATKSTWFAAGHEPDEPYPEGTDMIPYFTKVVAYDALAAVGAAGEDVLDAFHIIKPYTRTDAEHPTHRIIGVPTIEAEPGHPALIADKNLDGNMMGVIITALMKGSVLASKQGLKSPA